MTTLSNQVVRAPGFLPRHVAAHSGTQASAVISESKAGGGYLAGQEDYGSDLWP